MAAFDRYYVPGVSASVDAGDAEIGFNTPPYDGMLEAGWMDAGTNTRLQFVDGSVVSWDTAALGTTSRRLDCSGWIAESGGAPMATDIPATLTITSIALGLDGELDIASVDSTIAVIVAGFRQQASGGIFTPPTGPTLCQIFDDTLMTNGGAGAGTFPFSGELATVDPLAGLSQANLRTVLQSATMLLRLWLINDTSTSFTAIFDRIRLHVVGTVPDTTARPRFQQTTLANGTTAWCKARIRNNARL